MLLFFLSQLWAVCALLELLCSYVTQPSKNISQKDFLKIRVLGHMLRIFLQTGWIAVLWYPGVTLPAAPRLLVAVGSRD